MLSRSLNWKSARHSRRRNGFSFIELLFSMAIILILYYLMFAPSEEAKQKKHMATCAENLRKMHLAMTFYATEHQDQFPYFKGATTSEAALSGLVPKYTTDTSIFLCPGKDMGSLKAGESFAQSRISYSYAMGLRKTDSRNTPLVTDAQVNTGLKLKGTLLFSPDGNSPGNNHAKYGGNVLYMDGHAETFTPATPTDLPLPQHAQWLNPKP